MKRKYQLISVILIISIVFGINSCNFDDHNKPLKINHIQILGSHNSYKEAIEPALMELLRAEDSARAFSLNYDHISLKGQLDLGLRNLEIDVAHDPNGGRYASPHGLELVKQLGVKPLPYDTLGKMNDPGFKVFHVQDIDFRSNCPRLKDALQEIKEWSKANPKHLPIIITINAKTKIIDRPGFARPLPFTTLTFDSLEAEILSIIPKDHFITPDDVRGDFETLEEAILAYNWPEIENSRGKIILMLDEKGEKLENYITGHPSLKGRLMFVNAEPGRPEAAFIILNKPIEYQDSIQKLVKLGYLVRTRSDAGNKEALVGDYTRYQAALTSGAQIISTDYYLTDKKFGANFKVQLPGGVIARCNPILSPSSCSNKRLE